MTEEEKISETITIGLKKLKAEDIEMISEEAYRLAEVHLGNNVPPSQLHNYDFVIDIDNSRKDLQISIEIIYNPSRILDKHQVITEEIIKAIFEDLDKYLKEKFST
ncbi:MAG: DUF3194 domain-containing protein [Candidatus Thorarchaeota archaeon]